jgi:hypothetical protein
MRRESRGGSEEMCHCAWQFFFSFHSSIHHLASGRQDETSKNNVIISISNNINVLSQTNNYCVLLLIVSYLFHVSLAPQFHKVFKFSTEFK